MTTDPTAIDPARVALEAEARVALGTYARRRVHLDQARTDAKVAELAAKGALAQLHRTIPGRTVVRYADGTVGLVAGVDWSIYRNADDLVSQPPHSSDLIVRKATKAGGWSARRARHYSRPAAYTVERQLTDDEVAELAAADAKAATR